MRRSPGSRSILDHLPGHRGGAVPGGGRLARLPEQADFGDRDQARDRPSGRPARLNLCRDARRCPHRDGRAPGPGTDEERNGRVVPADRDREPGSWRKALVGSFVGDLTSEAAHRCSHRRLPEAVESCLVDGCFCGGDMSPPQLRGRVIIDVIAVRRARFRRGAPAEGRARGRAGCGWSGSRPQAVILARDKALAEPAEAQAAVLSLKDAIIRRSEKYGPAPGRARCRRAPPGC